jgi:hypothetical protein
MAQGEFTKEEATATLATIEEIYKAIPKSKRGDYLGHLNDACLFVEAAKRAAPEETKKGKR